MNGARKRRQDLELRPGIAIPAMGYVASFAFAVAAVIVVAHPGPHNHSLGARWGFGQIVMIFVWGFYKMGSQRIILSPDVMRVISLLQIWNVRRGAVQEAAPSDDLYALVISLTDGSVIEPVMFMIRGRVGLTRNAMSRETISDRITEWSAGALPEIEDDARPPAWRQIRLNLLLLLALSALVAVEANALTWANVWLTMFEVGDGRPFRRGEHERGPQQGVGASTPSPKVPVSVSVSGGTTTRSS